MKMLHLTTLETFKNALIHSLKMNQVVNSGMEVLAYSPGVIAVKFEGFSYYYNKNETVFAVYSNIQLDKGCEVFNCDFVGRDSDGAMRQFAGFAANILVTGYPYQGKNVNVKFTK